MNRREMEIELFPVPKHQLCDEDKCHDKTWEVFILTSMENLKDT